MDLLVSVWFLTFCFADSFGSRVPRQVDFLSEIDNLSDESSDIVPYQLEATDVPGETAEGEFGGRPTLFEDPKVYGMNIGLHFLLQSLNMKLDNGDRVHLESLIKVLVMTHNIEKVGGVVNDDNKAALGNVSKLYPVALREAISEA